MQYNQKQTEMNLDLKKVSWSPRSNSQTFAVDFPHSKKARIKNYSGSQRVDENRTF